MSGGNTFLPRAIETVTKAINHDTHGRVNIKCATAEHRGHDTHGYQTTHGAKATTVRTDARADYIEIPREATATSIRCTTKTR